MVPVARPLLVTKTASLASASPLPARQPLVHVIVHRIELAISKALGVPPSELFREFK
jgi:hypothetical protein